MATLADISKLLRDYYFRTPERVVEMLQACADDPEASKEILQEAERRGYRVGELVDAAIGRDTPVWEMFTSKAQTHCSSKASRSCLLP